MISIIVPVYKVEKYLPACIESVLAQTYQDWELLLIDDGSPDSCPAICDEYAKKDTRIRAIHKENGGVGSARNKGLDEAKGEYVMFLDSDDMLVSDALYIASHKIVENNVDVLCFQYRIIRDGGSNTPIVQIEDGEHIDNIEYAKKVLLGQVPMVIWGKLYKRPVLDNKRFVDYLKVGEDYLFLLDVFFTHKSIIYTTSDRLYLYRIITNSLSRQQSNDKILEWKNSFTKELVKLTETLDKVVSEDIHELLANAIVNSIIDKSKYQNHVIKTISNEDLQTLKTYCHYISHLSNIQSRLSQIQVPDRKSEHSFALTYFHIMKKVNCLKNIIIQKCGL